MVRVAANQPVATAPWRGMATTDGLISELEARVDRISRLASMVARNRQEADDLAQDTLLRALQRLDSFDPSRGSFDNWLWAIVVSLASDAARRGYRRQRLLERLRNVRRETPDAERLALDRLRNEELREAVRRLAPRDRLLIALRFGAGLPPTEAGAHVGLRPEAAQKALRRAVLKLRSRLTEV